MSNHGLIIRWKLVIAVVLSGAFMLAWALFSLKIDTDVLSSLPPGDRAISDARYIFEHHPIQDQIAIDLALDSGGPDLLVDGAVAVETLLKQSGLFSSVGTEEMMDRMPGLMDHVLSSMPLLFTEKDLYEKIEPLLQPDLIREKLQSHLDSLADLEGVGSAEFISRDPLGFSACIFEKLAALAPSMKNSFYRGHLLSENGKHVLIIARPVKSAMDTAVAAEISDVFIAAQKELKNKFGARGSSFTLTPVGAFRASLDNERSARADVQRAVVFATIGILLLLLFSFPRPYMGILALVPALFGTVAAFFTFSLVYDSISVMALGFGGAVISITVDHGIAYMLFLDRPYDTSGSAAAREVRSVGLLAALTTVGAFLSLYISGFAILVQIGLFAALGIAYSFIFIHTIFNRMFPRIPAAPADRRLPVISFISRIVAAGGNYKLALAVVFAAVMAFFAAPEFTVDLNAMNSVSRETLDAEKLVSETWGNVFDRVYMLVEGRDLADLKQAGDRITAMIEDDVSGQRLNPSFSLSMIFPGEDRARANLSAWNRFWSARRLAKMRNELRSCARETGFSDSAFVPFLRLFSGAHSVRMDIPENLYRILGISRNTQTGSWMSFVSLRPGSNYDSASFFERYSRVNTLKIFDPSFFSQRLGRHLSGTFIRMMIVICISVVVLLVFFFLDAALAIVSLLPIVFAMLSTLGTLNLLGHPFGIPELMLSIVIVGMGIDYSLYLVRAAQRYGSLKRENAGLVSTTVFLASASTLIGFGALLFADHSLLRGAGIACFFGIGYSLIGAFTILPPLLERIFAGRDTTATGQGVPGTIAQRRKAVNARYRHREAYPRVFARIKMMTDPMFGEIDRYLNNPSVVFDIGAGYGIPAAWILCGHPGARVYGIEPDHERAWVANIIAGGDGEVRQGAAPDLPGFPLKADTVLMLDMVHHLDNEALKRTLKNIGDVTLPSHRIIIRMTVPSGKKFPFMRWIETFRLGLALKKPCYRTVRDMEDLLKNNGYAPGVHEPSGSGREESWIIADRTEGRA